MNRNKLALLGGTLVVASAAGLAPHFWVAAALLLGGTSIASLAAYAFHRHSASRRARSPVNFHVGQPCSLYPMEEQALLVARIESLRQTSGEPSIGFQNGQPERALRRAFSERVYVRKMLARRPGTCRKRRHLMEWGHS